MALSPRAALRRIVTVRSHATIKSHAPKLANWAGPDLTIAVIADLHVISPWTSLKHVARIVDQVNRLEPDLIVLAGDYLADAALVGRAEDATAIVEVLTDLTSPLGTVAILGNHDWQDCPVARDSSFQRNSVAEALEPTNISLLQNSAVVKEHEGREFWLVGFDSQRPTGKDWSKGLHRPEEAFSSIPTDAPTILLAHEPDYFAECDDRAPLQISGHTHGGQMNLFGWRPMTPSRFGSRYAYGHKTDGDRHLIVSGGVGFSGLPMRIGQPPEITLVKVSGSKTQRQG